jgi:hypothetical protein
MAIYHLHVKVIGRKAGSSAVASAAYRSASRLRDDRLDRSHDFSAKRGVVHSEVMLPEEAPDAWRDRERLWNDVEAFELRKDAQLAREVEFALPREMTQAQGIELAHDFVQSEFVDQGMVADLNVHWDTRPACQPGRITGHKGARLPSGPIRPGMGSASPNGEPSTTNGPIIEEDGKNISRVLGPASAAASRMERARATLSPITIFPVISVALTVVFVSRQGRVEPISARGIGDGERRGDY